MSNTDSSRRFAAKAKRSPSWLQPPHRCFARAVRARGSLRREAPRRCFARRPSLSSQSVSGVTVPFSRRKSWVRSLPPASIPKINSSRSGEKEANDIRSSKKVRWSGRARGSESDQTWGGAGRIEEEGEFTVRGKGPAGGAADVEILLDVRGHG